MTLFLPSRLSFSQLSKGLRPPLKRPSIHVRADIDAEPLGDKRQAYISALNTISNFSEYTPQKAIALLAVLRKNPKSEPFLYPVDPVALNIPDYPIIIKEPIDFQTIQKNVDSGLYKSFADFDADVLKVFSNAMLYNPPGSVIHRQAEELKNFYLKQSQQKTTGNGLASKKNSKS